MFVPEPLAAQKLLHPLKRFVDIQSPRWMLEAKPAEAQSTLQAGKEELVKLDEKAQNIAKAIEEGVPAKEFAERLKALDQKRLEVMEWVKEAERNLALEDSVENLSTLIGDF